MSNYTKGNLIGRQKRGNNIYEYIVYAENGRRAIAEIDGIDSKENKANAILFAAAPELLDALHFCRGFICGAGFKDEPTNCIFKVIDEAIAKAEKTD